MRDAANGCTEKKNIFLIIKEEGNENILENIQQK